jgi:TolC family type I secretion outer membrane protein
VARAESEVDAGRAVLRSVEQDVLLGAVTAYMDVWRDQAVLQLNINNEQVLARQLEATQDRFDVGELTRTDIAQSEARLARATAQRIEAEGNLTASRAVFQEVVGFLPGTLEAPPALGGLPANEQEVIAAARDDNPAVLSARFAEQAARHQVRVATGELLPEVSLTAEVLHSENEFSDDSEITQARVLAVVSIPLYQQGFVSSRVRQAKQDASRRRVEINEARRRVEQDAIDAWKELVTARAEIRSFESEVRSQEIALEGVREENSVGARTVLDVLDAEQELLDAQVRLVTAQRDEVVAAYRVQQVQGRLTAAELELPVDVYNAEADYLAVRDRWFGLDIPEE